MLQITEDLVKKFGRRYPKDTMIFCEYEKGDEFFLIVSGKIKITKVINNIEKIIDILGPGDIFGEMALLEEAPRSASAITAEDSILLVFNKESFNKFFKLSPQIAYKLLVILSKRIYDAKRRLSILAFKDPLLRVSDVLIMLAEKSDPNYKTIRTIELDTNIKDIASWAAIDEETCKKALNILAKRGIIEIKEKSIFIKNLGDLIRNVNTKRKELSRRS